MASNVSEIGHTHIPVLDLADYMRGDPGSPEMLATELRDALENIGFFYIINHGVSQDLIDSTFEANREFHAMPIERKMAVEINKSLIGYMPDLGQKLITSKYADGEKPDRGEAFFMTRETGPGLTRSPNLWPPELPGFRDVLIAYYETMEELGMKLLPLFARALDLPADYFAGDFLKNETQSFVRASHYPPDALLEGQYSCGPHTDGSYLTLLATSNVPGLQILTADGEWIKAPLWRGCFLVNSGDMVTRWSNGRVLSTPHRVINDGGEDRYALPFFMQPNADAMLECLPTCCGPDNPAREEPITCADYLAWYLEENFAHYGENDKYVVT